MLIVYYHTDRWTVVQDNMDASIIEIKRIQRLLQRPEECCTKLEFCLISDDGYGQIVRDLHESFLFIQKHPHLKASGKVHDVAKKTWKKVVETIQNEVVKQCTELPTMTKSKLEFESVEILESLQLVQIMELLHDCDEKGGIEVYVRMRKETLLEIKMNSSDVHTDMDYVEQLEHLMAVLTVSLTSLAINLY